MVWFQVDDGMWSHPKMLGLSPSAGWLWVRAGTYCAQHLTDGFIPSGALRILGAEPDDVAELLDAGLWVEASDGCVFHDWHAYQRTRKQVESDRQSARERQAKARERKSHAVTDDVSNAVSHGVTNGVTNGVSHAARALPNRAEPIKTKDMLTADAASDPFDEFWTVYPRKVGKQAARKAWKQALKRTDAATIVAACRVMSADPNLPDREFVPHPATWLNRDGWDDEPYPTTTPAPGTRPTLVPPRFDASQHRPADAVPPPANLRQLIQGESA